MANYISDSDSDSDLDQEVFRITQNFSNCYSERQTKFDPERQTKFDPERQTKFDPERQTKFDPERQTKFLNIRRILIMKMIKIIFLIHQKTERNFVLYLENIFKIIILHYQK
jgi:hypothetical protein